MFPDCPIPVDTRRRCNVHKTSIRRRRLVSTGMYLSINDRGRLVFNTVGRKATHFLVDL